MAKAQTARKSKAKSKLKVGTKKAKMPKRKMSSKAKKISKKTTKKSSAKTSKKSLPAKRPSKKSKVTFVSNATPRLSVIKAAKVERPEATRVGVGDTAPNFTLNDQNGQPVSLSDFLGKKVVLYFYPKDDTPGCTKEACSFRDNSANFEGQDAVLLGVSFDDGDSHQRFISKYGLNFKLLSDLDKKVAQDYGCYVQKNMYGNISWGIERSTFVIDRQGKIAAAIRRVQVDGHTHEVLEALKEIE